MSTTDDLTTHPPAADDTGNPDPLLDTAAGAEYLAVNKWTMGELVRCGAVAHVRIGRRVRIRRSALEAYLEGATKPAKAQP